MMISPQFMQKLMEFKRNYRGNAQQEVMQKLQSGEISQTQLDQAQRMATQIMSMFGMKR